MSKPSTSIQSNFSLGKAEHLCRQSIIDALYEQSQSVFSHPFKINYLKLPILPAPDWVKIQVLFPVSKRKYKRAVKRNSTRRVTRELFRLNRADFMSELNNCPFKLAISIAYIDNTPIDFHKNGPAMRKALKKLSDLICNYV